jgi:hypothetical protein
MKQLKRFLLVSGIFAVFFSAKSYHPTLSPHIGPVGYTAVAGTQDFVIPGSVNKGYPGTSQNGTAIPYRVYTPQDAADVMNGAPGSVKGQKFPAMLFHHGCGEKTDAQADRTNLNTSELSELQNTQPFNQVINSSGSMWNRYYTYDSEGHSTQIFMFGPQLWGGTGSPDGGCTLSSGGYTFTYLYLTWYMLQEIRTKYYDIVDTNKIFIAGLSQGGGACNLAIQDSVICSMLSAALICCPGYDNYSGFAPTGRTNPTDNFNWDDVAASGLPIWYIHSENDNTTLDCGGGSGCSRNSVISINARNPLVVPMFDEPTGTSHSLSWTRMLAPSNWDIVTNNSNGSTFTMNRGNPARNPIEWALQFSKDRAVSRRPDGR